MTAVDLDYDPDDQGTAPIRTFNVTVRATDSAGAATGGTEPGDPDDATVTITLVNVNEPPIFPVEAVTTITRFFEGMTALALTGSEATVTYTATDPDNDQVTLSLSGADKDLFILSADSVLSFKMEPDYEKPMDRNKDNVYEVTVRASDGTLHVDRMVTITVNDVNDAPMITKGSTTIKYAENGTDPVETFTATDPEGRMVVYWSLANGHQLDDVVDAADIADEAHFMIGPNDGVLKLHQTRPTSRPRQIPMSPITPTRWWWRPPTQ